MVLRVGIGRRDSASKPLTSWRRILYLTGKQNNTSPSGTFTQHGRQSAKTKRLLDHLGKGGTVSRANKMLSSPALLLAVPLRVDWHGPSDKSKVDSAAGKPHQNNPNVQWTQQNGVGGSQGYHRTSGTSCRSVRPSPIFWQNQRKTTRES